MGAQDSWREVGFRRRISLSNGQEMISLSLNEDISDNRSSTMTQSQGSDKKNECIYTLQNLDINGDSQRHGGRANPPQHTRERILKIPAGSNLFESSSTICNNYFTSLDRISEPHGLCRPSQNPSLRRQPELRNSRARDDV